MGEFWTTDINWRRKNVEAEPTAKCSGQAVDRDTVRKGQGNVFSTGATLEHEGCQGGSVDWVARKWEEVVHRPRWSGKTDHSYLRISNGRSFRCLSIRLNSIMSHCQ
ncbi:hypothetical protein J6590_059985 [Homalodisca vitripennis]|nr:hypothetical protein J6590_059985 [Homalodisca vitripennis]